MQLSLYKLVQYLKNYINPKRKESSIKIELQTAWKWLHHLSFEYKNMKKDVFVDRYKWSDIIKDCKKSLNKINKLKLYIIKFNEDYAINNKTYLPKCAVESKDC